jgi:hypothetical protein
MGCGVRDPPNANKQKNIFGILFLTTILAGVSLFCKEVAFFFKQTRRYKEITHDPLPFNEAQGIF